MSRDELTIEELNSLRMLAPRRSTEDFLAQDFIPSFPTHGACLTLRVHQRVIHDVVVSFPDAAQWRLPALNVEVPSFAHQGFAGTLGELCEKTAQDLQRVASHYPAAQSVKIMETVRGLEALVSGRDPSVTTATTTATTTTATSSAIILMIRDPTGLVRSNYMSANILREMHQVSCECVKYKEQSTSFFESLQSNKNNSNDADADDDDEEEEKEEISWIVNSPIQHLTLDPPRVPIYSRSLFRRSWEDENELGMIQNSSSSNSHQQQLTSASDLAHLLLSAKNVVALTGAGQSVESGIAAFRTDTDEAGRAIWGTFDAHMMTSNNFNTRPDVVEGWWKMKLQLYPQFAAAVPTAAHNIFGLLEKLGLLRALVTQNIDSLNSDTVNKTGGVSPSKLLELHGYMRTLICANNATDQYREWNSAPAGDGCCNFATDEHMADLAHFAANVGAFNQYMYEKYGKDAAAPPPVFADGRFECLRATQEKGSGVVVPFCPRCGCVLRTPTIMFGQSLPASVWNLARRATDEADVFIVVGTSLVVKPASDLPGQALQNTTPLVMINRDETAYDSYACGVFREPAGKFLAEVMKEMELILAQ